MRLAAACLAAAMIAVSGCGRDRTRSYTDTYPQVDVVAPERDIDAGQALALRARTRSVAGRDAQVEWASTGGTIHADEDGKAARVAFPEAGIYTVTAKLYVDGREVDREVVTVNVRPTRAGPGAPDSPTGSNQP